MKEAGEEGNDVTHETVVEPQVLYKYGRFDDYTKRVFTHSEIYFSLPNGFNDPFDSKPHVTCDGTMTERKRYLCKQYQQKHPERSKEDILTFKEDILTFVDMEILTNFKGPSFDLVGVKSNTTLCLSST